MYTSTMEDIARGVLAGLAIGGFTPVMIEANILALKTLWRFNRLAFDTAHDMLQGVLRGCNERKAQEIDIKWQRIRDELKNAS